MFKKNINTLALITLIVSTLAVFSKNFYNEIINIYLNNPDFFQAFFSDFYLIYAGSELLSQNLNPYKEWLQLHNSPFFNPPIVFYFFKFISNFEYTTIAKIWFLISFLSFILIPIIFFKIFKLEQKYSLIFILCFGGISLSVFLTGNLSVILSSFFAFSLFLMSKGKEHSFYLILSLLSLIKFPYLIFFGIPFLVKGLKKEIFLNTFFYLFFIALIYLISFYYNPDLFYSWLNSLEYAKQIGDRGDFGRGLFRILDNYFFSNTFLNYFIYFLISGTLFIFSIFLFNKSKFLNEKKNKDIAIALSIIILTMLLPRLKSYDVLVTIPCLFFIIKIIRFKISEDLNSFIKFLLFLLLFCWTSPYAPITFYLIILITVSSDLKFNFIEKNKKL